MNSRSLLRNLFCEGIITSFLSYFLFIYGCATNPATKETQFMLVSEEKEFNIGKEVDKQVREEIGLYFETPELRSFVQNMGMAIGKSSDRPDLIYRTEIVDTTDFNAFAVPGGFVYVHRGLLERVNSADELASVMGHEIAHVAARHSASQISKSQLLNVGLFALDVATQGATRSYDPLINLGSVLAFSKFSRDDEREADHFGARYVAEAGYNPKASLDVMKQIQKLYEKEPSELEVWFMTHPATSERIENLTQEIEWFRQNKPEVLDRPKQRNEFIALLENMAVGQWNGSELIKKDHYYNKEYLLTIDIPPEWIAEINNKKFTAVFAQQKAGYLVYFNVEQLQKNLTSASYFEKYEKQLIGLGLKKNPELKTSARLPHGALAGIYSGRDSNNGNIVVETIAFVKGTNGFSLLCISKEQDFKNFQPMAESMAEGIIFISQEESANIHPDRLRVHKVEKGETWALITQRYFGSSQDMARLAEYNGFENLEEATVGTLLKIPPSFHTR